jgi:hypothetical protein
LGRVDAVEDPRRFPEPAQSPAVCGAERASGKPQLRKNHSHFLHKSVHPVGSSLLPLIGLLNLQPGAQFLSCRLEGLLESAPTDNGFGGDCRSGDDCSAKRYNLVVCTSRPHTRLCKTRPPRLWRWIRAFRPPRFRLQSRHRRG